jgi:hypothetical protein
LIHLIGSTHNPDTAPDCEATRGIDNPSPARLIDTELTSSCERYIAIPVIIEDDVDGEGKPINDIAGGE